MKKTTNSSSADTEPTKPRRGRPPKNASPETIKAKAEIPGEQPVKRKRGRPRKNPLPEEQTTVATEAESPKRKRGRPRKQPEQEAVSTTASSNDAAAVNPEEPPKRKRGRPRKNPLPAETAPQPNATADGDGSTKRKRGRPRKNTTQETPENKDSSSTKTIKKPTVRVSRPKSKPAPKIEEPQVRRTIMDPVLQAQIKAAEAAQAKAGTKVTLHEGQLKFDQYQTKEDEEYMSKGMEAHFRAILETWRMELMQEVDRTLHHLQDEAANFPDPNDRATQESEFAMELRARDRERKLIKKISDSLDQLGEGEYGYCKACGIEIGLRRLEARPTADLCIECKTLDEIREKQTG